AGDDLPRILALFAEHVKELAGLLRALGARVPDFLSRGERSGEHPDHRKVSGVGLAARLEDERGEVRAWLWLEFHLLLGPRLRADDRSAIQRGRHEPDEGIRSEERRVGKSGE